MLARELAVIAASLCAAVAVGSTAAALETRYSRASRASTASPAQPQDLGTMLAEGLRATPGCLAADVAQWDSGKRSVVGWFEDKDAVIAWYDSQMHRHLMQPMGGPQGEPLAHVPDDQGPIMVIATITPSDRPIIEGFPAPIGQISIEMFAPLPGGAYINGRLAPDGFEVEHMRDLAAQDGR